MVRMTNNRHEGATMSEDFDLGAYVGIGLTTRQLGFLAGVLFFGIFAFIAMRRAQDTGGIFAAVWGTIGIGLFAAGLYVAAAGLDSYLPPWVLPFTKTETLLRTSALAMAGCWIFVFLVAYSAEGEWQRWWFRIVGLVLLGVTVTYGVAWFQDDLPPEAKRWTTREIIFQMGVGLGLLFLCVALWYQSRFAVPHQMWLYRAGIPLILGFMVWAGLQQYGNDVIPAEWHDFPFARVVWALSGIGFACAIAIAAGAWFLRDQPIQVKESPVVIARPPSPKATPPLPVAVQVDEHGRPILPPQS